MGIRTTRSQTLSRDLARGYVEEGMKNADYRKINDRSLNSSTYHKKDGTNVRAKLKQQLRRDVNSL